MVRPKPGIVMALTKEPGPEPPRTALWIGTWVRGRVTKIEGGWGTVLDESGHLILADIDRDALWDCFRCWK